MIEGPPTRSRSSLEGHEVVVALCALTILTFLLNIRGLISGDLLLDDWFNVRWLQHPSQIFEIFIGNWQFGERGGGFGDYLYRPIPRLSFLWDRMVWGLDNPAGFHLTNTLLQSLNVFFVWGIAWSLWRERRLAWGAALIFLGHPLNVEAVQWVSARTDLWAGVFALPAIWITISQSDREPMPRFRVTRFWSLVFLQLGLCSKETIAALPAILLLIDLTHQRGFSRARVVWWVLTIALGVLYFVQRRWMFGTMLGLGIGGQDYMTVGGAWEVLFEFSRLFLNPFRNWPAWAWGISLGFVAIVWVVAAFTALWEGRTSGVLIGLAIVFFGLAPLFPPRLGFGLNGNTRLLLLAVAGGSLVIVGVLNAIMRSPRWQINLLIFGIAPLAVMSFIVTGHWADASRISRATIETILEDLDTFDTVEMVHCTAAPSASGRAFIFRLNELQLAIERMTEERNGSVTPALLEQSPSNEILFRPLGSDRPFHRATVTYHFAWSTPPSEQNEWRGDLAIIREVNGQRVEIGEVESVPPQVGIEEVLR